MKNTQKQTLRLTAEKAKDNFMPSITIPTLDVLALLDELGAAEQGLIHGHKMFQREKARAEAAEKRIAELEAREETLRPVGVMSEKAFHRLEGSESRFIALWPRPGIYLPRKRPDDGVIVYARTAAGIKGE